MNRRIRVAALAIVAAGATHMATPPTAGATLAPAPSPFGGDGVAYCCYSIDHTRSCCFESGCIVSANGCFKIY